VRFSAAFVLSGLSALAVACVRPVAHPPACPLDCPTGAAGATPATPPPEHAEAAAYVHRVGLGLADENGRALTLRGTNLGGWLLWEGWIWGAKLDLLDMGRQSQSSIEERLAEAAGADAMCHFRDEVRSRFVTDDDIAAIASAGLNVVRVPLNHRDFACASSPGWAALDRLLGWCEARHVYAVLELHSAPGGQTSYFISDPEEVSLWDSQGAQDRTVALWQAIARRYRGRSIVAGYDLLGEPRPPRNAVLVPLYQRIVAAIREVDPHHLLIVEGTDFARDFSMFTAGPLDPNQIYSFHMYTWFGDDRARRLRGYAAIAAAQGVPMWCGEFGENTLPVLASTLDLFDAQSPALVGWSYWTWKRALPSGWTTWHGFQQPARWNRLINWAVNDSGSRPTPDEARGAMGDFLDATVVGHLTTDAALDAALSAHARR
jgi:hypothetical protein